MDQPSTIFENEEPEFCSPKYHDICQIADLQKQIMHLIQKNQTSFHLESELKIKAIYNQWKEDVKLMRDAFNRKSQDFLLDQHSSLTNEIKKLLIFLGKNQRIHISNELLANIEEVVFEKANYLRFFGFLEQYYKTLEDKFLIFFHENIDKYVETECYRINSKTVEQSTLLDTIKMKLERNGLKKHTSLILPLIENKIKLNTVQKEKEINEMLHDFTNEAFISMSKYQRKYLYFIFGLSKYKNKKLIQNINDEFNQYQKELMQIDSMFDNVSRSG